MTRPPPRDIEPYDFIASLGDWWLAQLGALAGGLGRLIWLGITTLCRRRGPRKPAGSAQEEQHVHPHRP